MKKKIFIGVLVLIVIAFFAYRYIYQNHRNISSETATYVITISEIEKEFKTNDSIASLKYQDQTIELTAQVTALEIEDNAIILDNKLYATFNDSLSKDVLVGTNVKVKGRFLGYDELLEEFKMDQSIIVR